MAALTAVVEEAVRLRRLRSRSRAPLNAARPVMLARAVLLRLRDAAAACRPGGARTDVLAPRRASLWAETASESSDDGVGNAGQRVGSGVAARPSRRCEASVNSRTRAAYTTRTAVRAIRGIYAIWYRC